jgi:hypothetical protein
MARTRARARYEIGVVDKSSEKLDDIQRNFSNFNDSILRVGGAFAGLAGAAGIGALINNVTQAGVQIHDLNKTMGAGIEAMSQYRHVASQSNVDFNLFTTSLSKMQIRISEAATGGGEAVKVLNELGLNAEKLASLAPEDQFEVIAQAFGGISDAGHRARIATKLFEESGVSLLKIIDQDVDGIRRLREEADRLGLTFSKEQVEAMADFDSKLNLVKNSVMGLAQVLITELGASLAGIANTLAVDIPSAFNWFGETLSAFKLHLLSFSRDAKEMMADFSGIMSTITFGETSKKWAEDQRRHMVDIVDFNTRISGEIQYQIDLFEEQERIAFRVADVFRNVYDPALKDVADTTGKATGKTKEHAEELDTMGRALDLISKQFEDLEVAAAQEFAGLTPAIKEANKETEKMNDTARDLGLTFASSFEEAITQAKGLSDILDGLLKDIQKIIVRKAITEPIANAIGGAIGGVFSGAGGATATTRGAYPGVTVNINGPISDAGLVPIINQAAEQGARRGYAMVANDLQGGGPIRAMIK